MKPEGKLGPGCDSLEYQAMEFGFGLVDNNEWAEADKQLRKMTHSNAGGW